MRTVFFILLSLVDGGSVSVNCNDLATVERGTTDTVSTLWMSNKTYTKVKETPEYILNKCNRRVL